MAVWPPGCCLPLETVKEESTSSFVTRTDAVLTKAECILQPLMVNALTEQTPDAVFSAQCDADVDLKRDLKSPNI